MRNWMKEIYNFLVIVGKSDSISTILISSNIIIFKNKRDKNSLILFKLLGNYFTGKKEILTKIKKVEKINIYKVARF